MGKLKCASFFAGVGGIDMGFEQTKFFKTVFKFQIQLSLGIGIGTYKKMVVQITVNAWIYMFVIFITFI